MHIQPDQLVSNHTVEQAVAVLCAFAGFDLNREQANRLLHWWVRYPTLQPREIAAILYRFPVGVQ
jgi:hypothetical protein